MCSILLLYIFIIFSSITNIANSQDFNPTPEVSEITLKLFHYDGNAKGLFFEVIDKSRSFSYKKEVKKKSDRYVINLRYLTKINDIVLKEKVKGYRFIENGKLYPQKINKIFVGIFPYDDIAIFESRIQLARYTKIFYKEEGEGEGERYQFSWNVD